MKVLILGICYLVLGVSLIGTIAIGGFITLCLAEAHVYFSIAAGATTVWVVVMLCTAFITLEKTL